LLNDYVIITLREKAEEERTCRGALRQKPGSAWDGELKDGRIAASQLKFSVF